MQQLFVLLLFILPFFVQGQSNGEQTKNHEEAINLLLQQRPNAKVVNLKKLTESQKGMHEKSTCGACASKRESKKVTSTTNSVKNLATLKKEEIRLTQLALGVQEAQDIDHGLLNKYAKALARVKQQIEKNELTQINQKKSK